MKTEKHTEATRYYRVEYPLFSGAEDVSLMNSFSETLASRLIAKGAARDMKFSLTYTVSEYDGSVEVAFRFTSRKGTERRTAAARIIWKDGYIIKFEES